MNTDTTQQDKSKIRVAKQVPPGMRDRYTERVKKATFGESKSSGQEMITLECEIIVPQFLVVDDKEYDLTSLDRKYYLSLGDTISPKTGKSPRDKTNSCLVLLGFEPLAKGEKPSEELLKKLNDKFCFDSIITSTQKPVQRKDNKTGEYVDIKDNRGQTIYRGWELSNNSDDILYRVDEPAGASPY